MNAITISVPLWWRLGQYLNALVQLAVSLLPQKKPQATVQ